MLKQLALVIPIALLTACASPKLQEPTHTPVDQARLTWEAIERYRTCQETLNDVEKICDNELFIPNSVRAQHDKLEQDYQAKHKVEQERREAEEEKARRQHFIDGHPNIFELRSMTEEEWKLLDAHFKSIK